MYAFIDNPSLSVWRFLNSLDNIEDNSIDRFLKDVGTKSIVGIVPQDIQGGFYVKIHNGMFVTFVKDPYEKIQERLIDRGLNLNNLHIG